MKDDALRRELDELKRRAAELRCDEYARVPREVGRLLDKCAWLIEHIAIRLDAVETITTKLGQLVERLQVPAKSPAPSPPDRLDDSLQSE